MAAQFFGSRYDQHSECGSKSNKAISNKKTPSWIPVQICTVRYLYECWSKSMLVQIVNQCCGSGMFYPGSRIRIRVFVHPGSRISDPGSRIPDPSSM
jgi:hypothetical protein